MKPIAQISSRDPRKMLFAGTAVGLLFFYYLLEISDLGSALRRASPPLNFTFNSMLWHLLQGRFDVDPRTVRYEGFSRNGLVYAYWGIFPSVLRLPLIVSSRWRDIDVTLWSCWIAVCIAVAIKLRTLNVIARAVPDTPSWLIRYAALALALSGAQICFLRSLLYQEVCLWAGVFAALFVFAAIREFLRRSTHEHNLELMALAFGGCVLTRVSVAVGLLAALGVAILAVLLRERGSQERSSKAAVVRSLIIAACCVAIAGFVNFERFGHITTFADYSIYNYNKLFPDRIQRTALYGLFNIARLPFGIVYYFFPIWVLQGSDHHLILGTMRDRLIDSAELPPGTFLLSDAFLLALGVCAIIGSARARLSDLDRRTFIAAMAAALTLPALLMLSAISMCFRYRMDFYPLIEFLAFVGIANYRGSDGKGRWLSRPVLLSLLIISILGSHLEMALYRLSDLGPAQQFLGGGIGRYYANLLF